MTLVYYINTYIYTYTYAHTHTHNHTHNIYSTIFKTQKSHNGTLNYIILKSELSQLHNIIIFKNKITCVYKCYIKK